jgi:hypothetical protein
MGITPFEAFALLLRSTSTRDRAKLIFIRLEVYMPPELAFEVEKQA